MKRILLILALMCACAPHGYSQAIPFIKPQWFTSTGVPAAGYQLCSYAAGTTTAQSTYATALDATNGTNAITSPRTLDSAGRLDVFLGARSYKFTLYTPTLTDCATGAGGTAIWTEDNIRASIPPSTASDISITDYGAVGDDSTDNTAAIQAAFDAAVAHQGTVLIPCGTFRFIGTLNFGTNSATAGTSNFGFNLTGTCGNGTAGVNKASALRSVRNGGIGIDLRGAARYNISNLTLLGGTVSSANAPQVLVLQAGADDGASGLIFSGIATFRNVQLSTYGAYGIYNFGAEQIDYNDTSCSTIAASSAYCWVFSKANTAAITSPNGTLKANSMTAISITGFTSHCVSAGTGCVLLDVGANSGIASITVSDFFASLTGATTHFLDDTGSGTSVLNRIDLRNIKIEANGGAGTNVVWHSTTPTVKELIVTGTLSSSTAQTATEFQFVNSGLTGSFFNWDPNDAGAHPTTLITLVGGGAADGTIFQCRCNASLIPFNNGNWSIYALDHVVQKAYSVTGTNDATFSTATDAGVRVHATGGSFAGSAAPFEISADNTAGAAYSFQKCVADYDGTPSTRCNINSVGRGGFYALGGLSGTPGAAGGAGAGSSPSAAIVGNDMAGYLEVTTGMTPSASSTVVTVTFNATQTSSTPRVLLTPANAVTAALSGAAQVFVSSSSASGWVVTVGSTNLTGSTTYGWFYHVIQ